MNTSNSTRQQPMGRLMLTGALLLVLLAGALTWRIWWPLLTSSPLAGPAAEHAADADPPTGHASHGDAGGAGSSHEASHTVRLSPRGLKNVGFEPFVVRSETYHQGLSLPAMVVERPGRSQLHITAPSTGIVTEIYSVTGEAVETDAALFELRLTHEDLVSSQRDFLRTVEELDVVTREIARLRSLGEGVIAGRRILEYQYEQQKLEAALRAESQAMLLHGITEDQIDEIRRSRRLLQSFIVRAPGHAHDDESCLSDHLFQVQRLEVAQGEQVVAGQELAVLSDHCELHIEGLAFEDDVPLIREVHQQGRHVTARLLTNDSATDQLEGLEVLYVADQIDPLSRAFKFYLRLPNKVAVDKTLPTGKRFLEWIYKPGQRMQLQVPVETWENQLTLPTTAVIAAGAEAYVYRQDGDAFDQVAVHVLHRDQDTAVIAADGAIFPGDVIAGRGAYQMHLALENQAGGGVDPHAGHNH
jgi:multidrug efflux pump subunit AcrA (membrane-fusion protein)